MEIRKKLFKSSVLEDEDDLKVDHKAKGISPAEILESLRGRLKEFHDLMPKLDEKRSILEKDVIQFQDKILEIESLIPKLEERKKNLEADLENIQKEINAIDEIKGLLEKI